MAITEYAASTARAFMAAEIAMAAVRARAFNSDCHPFEVGRSAIRVRAKYGYSLPPDLSTDGSCSSPSSQSSSLAPAIIGSCKVRGLFSLLSETCANVVASASARIAEHFRQLLDPVVPTLGPRIEIEGLGRCLVRDAHAEPDSDISTTPTLDRVSSSVGETVQATRDRSSY
jgi:hypothetical protein